MPMFEYRCADCGYEFEELVYGDKKVVCPKCKSEKTEKKLSMFSSAGGSNKGTASCNNFT